MDQEFQNQLTQFTFLNEGSRALLLQQEEKGVLTTAAKEQILALCEAREQEFLNGKLQVLDLIHTLSEDMKVNAQQLQNAVVTHANSVSKESDTIAAEDLLSHI